MKKKGEGKGGQGKVGEGRGKAGTRQGQGRRQCRSTPGARQGQGKGHGTKPYINYRGRFLRKRKALRRGNARGIASHGVRTLLGTPRQEKMRMLP